MIEEQTYFGVNQVEVTETIGKNACITRTDGKPFVTCSFLRHHRGKRIETPVLTVSADMIKSTRTDK